MGQLLDSLFQLLTELGYWGILLGLMVEVIPSELILAYGGFLVSVGEITFMQAVGFGTVGGVLAQLFIYWIGKYGGRPFLDKYGKYLFIQKRHLDLSEQWFQKYGTGVIFTARFIPIVRHAISIPAGIAGMPLPRFTLLTTLAVIPWSVLFISLGMSLGASYAQIGEKAESYAMPMMVGAVLLMLGYLALKWHRKQPNLSQDIREKEAQMLNPKTEYRPKNEDEVVAGTQRLGLSKIVMKQKRIKAPNGTEQLIDRLIITPAGIFHICDWHSDLPNDDQAGRLYRQHYVLRELLRREGISAEIHGIFCSKEMSENHLMKYIGGFPLIAVSRLDHYVTKKRIRIRISPAEIASIAHAIECSEA